MVSKLSWLLIAAGVPGALAAQTPASVQRAVNSVTPQDVVRRIAIIADDSMLGRATPSPQLEQVAQYIAAEFQRFGLRPGGERGTYLQRYPVERAVLATDSSAVWSTGSLALRWAYGTDLVEVDGRTPADAISGQVLVLVGAVPDSGGIDSAAVAGKMLLVLRPSRGARRLLGWNPAAVLIPSTAPDSIWPLIAGRFGSGGWRQPGAGVATTAPPQFLLRQPALRPLLSQLGLTLEAARQAPFAALAVAGTTLHARVLEQVAERATAPNVIGILEGSDPTLKGEYLFFTGHMDHLGTPGSGEDCVAKGADSICNGADDDGSGTIAVVKLAEAFSQLTPRPRRSLVFMTVSGEERGLWGSEYFSEHPTVPLASIVADLNTDMIGRNWKDTIAVIGKEHSDLGATLNRVAAAHPELHMTPIDDIWPQENFYFRSDHYNFARKGVPILFFFNGTHADYHQVSDEVAKIDGEKESRIIKLDFYLGLDVANRTARPKWNPDSYRRIVQRTGN